MTRKDILEEAAKCVCGQREQDYGSPESNFQIIADLWNAYTGHKYTPVDVANMMILLKLARIKNGGGTGDSFVDIAGYAACGGEINAEKDTKDRNCSKCRFYNHSAKECMKRGKCMYQEGCWEDDNRCVSCAFGPSVFEEPGKRCNGCVNYSHHTTIEDKRDDTCNTCCFGPDVFEDPIYVCNDCKNHSFYRKSIDMWRSTNDQNRKDRSLWMGSCDSWHAKPDELVGEE